MSPKKTTEAVELTERERDTIVRGLCAQRDKLRAEADFIQATIDRLREGGG